MAYSMISIPLPITRRRPPLPEPLPEPVRVEFFVGYKETGLSEFPFDAIFETQEKAEKARISLPGSNLFMVFRNEIYRCVKQSYSVYSVPALSNLTKR